MGPVPIGRTIGVVNCGTNRYELPLISVASRGGRVVETALGRCNIVSWILVGEAFGL